MTTEKTGTTEHVWVRDPEEDWKPLRGKIAEKFPDWLDVVFECSVCGCVGHAMTKKGKPPPDRPEEVKNVYTRELVDAYGDCSEQTVVSVHAQ